jgi:hypothetical protein
LFAERTAYNERRMEASKLERLQAKARKRNAIEPVKPELGAAIATDQHYSVRQVSAMWGMSPRTIRRMFGTMPGVIKLGQRKTTLFIPHRLLEEKHRELAG